MKAEKVVKCNNGSFIGKETEDVIGGEVRSERALRRDARCRDAVGQEAGQRCLKAGLLMAAPE